jgi:hypothetical protein
MTERLVDGIAAAPGSGILTAAASGATVRGVDLAAGTALVRGHWYNNSATLTLASSANAAGSARIDRLVLRLNRSANTIAATVLAGTAGSGQPPALTDNATTTDRPLWKWTVAPGATAVTGLTDERQYLANPLRPCTSANRPYDPQTGDLAVETDTGNVIRYSGSAWTALADDTGWVTVPTQSGWAADAANPLRVRRVGAVVHFRGVVNRTGSTLPATTDDSGVATLPAGCRPANWHYYGTWMFPGACLMRIGTDGDVRLRTHSDDVPVGRALYLSTTFMTLS